MGDMPYYHSHVSVPVCYSFRPEEVELLGPGYSVLFMAPSSKGRDLSLTLVTLTRGPVAWMGGDAGWQLSLSVWTQKCVCHVYVGGVKAMSKGGVEDREEWPVLGLGTPKIQSQGGREAQAENEAELVCWREYLLLYRWRSVSRG